MIYLDNAATTFLDKKASEIYSKYACEFFYNPSAIYREGALIQNEIDWVRNIIKKQIGASEGDIIFTSGATESNNLALRGVYKKSFGKILVFMGEHPSVYNTALKMQELGANVEFIAIDKNGEIDYEDLKQKIDETVSLISVMLVSNETGAINDLKKIYDLKQSICPNAIFHTDAVQGFGKVKINVEYFGVDLLTISGHKIFGPKGIGALWVKDKKILHQVVFGGGQEYNLRSGTLNVPAIIALGEVVNNFDNITENFEYVSKLKNEFLSQLKCDYTINGGNNPYILSISFDGVNGETLTSMMQEKGILISRGSACSSKKAGNRILEGMGKSKKQVLGSVRISFSKYNTNCEVKYAAEVLNDCYFSLVNKLK